MYICKCYTYVCMCVYTSLSLSIYIYIYTHVRLPTARIQGLQDLLGLHLGGRERGRSAGLEAVPRSVSYYNE